MTRPIYEPIHEEFRELTRGFFDRHVAPHYMDWERAGIIDRSVWEFAGQAGLIGINTPEEYGGGIGGDFRFHMVIDEESARGGYTSLTNGWNVHDNIVTPYIADLGTEEQKAEWLPRMMEGTAIGAIAMTEPDAGSDLRGIRSRAQHDGSDWILNGSKTFITNGVHADVCIVFARTSERGYSLFLVDTSIPGFDHDSKVEKVGLRSGDTAEIFMSDVRLPGSALLGELDRGLSHLMERLPRERLGIASMATASIRASFDGTARYMFEREAFGQRLGDLQSVRFTLAELSTYADVAEMYLDRSALAINDGSLSPTDAAKVKWFLSEMQFTVVNRCVQLHGGYGYNLEFPIARAFADSRVQTIYGGSTEIMKEIIGRDIAATYNATRR